MYCLGSSCNGPNYYLTAKGVNAMDGSCSDTRLPSGSNRTIIDEHYLHMGWYRIGFILPPCRQILLRSLTRSVLFMLELLVVPW